MRKIVGGGKGDLITEGHTRGPSGTITFYFLSHNCGYDSVHIILLLEHRHVL